MFGCKPPFRLGVGAALLDGEARSAAELVQLLVLRYPGERQVNEKEVEHHLQALKGVGILDIAQESMEDGVYVQRYTVTAHGRERIVRAL